MLLMRHCSLVISSVSALSALSVVTILKIDLEESMVALRNKGACPAGYPAGKKKDVVLRHWMSRYTYTSRRLVVLRC